MTAIYLDTLDPERRKVFLKLRPLIKQGAVLAGGTALSLQIKHRYSFDFDIFFEKDVVRSVFKALGRLVDIKEKRVDQTHFITILTKNNIQITLFRYEFPRLYPKIKTKSIPLFHFKDIAADKAYVLGQRPAWRDYVDLFFLLKDKHISLEDLIKDAKRKFKAGFAPKLFLEQLTYYGDIKEFKVEFVGKEYSPEQIQEFLKKKVSGYVKIELNYA